MTPDDATSIGSELHETLCADDVQILRRVLFVIQPQDGGSVRHVVLLARALAELGVEVDILCDPRIDRAGELAELGGLMLMPMKRRPEVSDLGSVRIISRLAAEHKYDVIHAHSSKAGALVRRAVKRAEYKPPVIYTPHMFSFRNPELPKPVRLLFRAVEKWLAPGTDVIVALSSEEEADARSLGGTATVVRATNGVENRVYPARSETDAVRIGFVGRLAGMKGVGVFLDALTLVLEEWPEVEVEIVGDGPLGARLRAQASQLGLGPSVSFLGARTDVISRLGTFDILAMPSLHEALPFVLLEAMMAGCAIVASAVGGIPDVIDHEKSGLLVQPGSTTELSKAILRLRDSKLREQLGRTAAARAQDLYSIEAMMKSHIAVYRAAGFEVPDVDNSITDFASARFETHQATTG